MSALLIPFVAWGFMSLIMVLSSVAYFVAQRLNGTEIAETHQWDAQTVEFKVVSNRALVYGKAGR